MSTFRVLRLVTGRYGRIFGCAVAVALIATTAPRAATLTVGPGQRYATIAAAVAATNDGDVVKVLAGTYTNDFATVTKRISIVGVNGMARLVATIPPPNGKAILTTTTDVTLKHLEFTGARVADLNGAGIRYEGGNLIVRRCFFHDNENGILGGSWPGGTVVVENSEFAHNGRGDGYTHGLYIGTIASLRVSWSYFYNTLIGHHIKSRSLKTIVNGNRLIDGDGRTASYSVDLPNGGDAQIYNNLIEQSVMGENSALIHFGGESVPHPSSALVVKNNTLQNFRHMAIGVLNHTPSYVVITANRLYQLPYLASGPNTATRNVVLAEPVEVSETSPWNK